MEALKLENISMKFGSFTAVNDISLTVEKGSFLTLLGPSGCGKTTLLKMIGGFYKPTNGKISINERDVTQLPPEKRNTTMCFQSYALFPHLTVAENITFGLKQQKISKPERIKRIEKVSDQVDLKTQLEKYPSMLSGGQQQRVALGRALAMRSDIILFDEPLSNLDAKLREQVRFEIRELQKEYGFTAIYVTHDQAEALAMSDNIAVMNKGKIEQYGTPEEIYKNPKSCFIADFIGTANIMEGEFSRRDDDFDYFSTPLGEIKIPSVKNDRKKSVMISWRPEEVEIDTDKTGDNVFTLTVHSSVYQGNITDLHLTNNKDSKNFRVQTLHNRKKEQGETVKIYIAPDNFTILESENE